MGQIGVLACFLLLLPRDFCQDGRGKTDSCCSLKRPLCDSYCFKVLVSDPSSKLIPYPESSQADSQGHWFFSTARSSSW
ncbi:hypothetical protein BKA61DRAFT_603966 [Leptodontidium sp. MPI-SDFR-AT-0119]|nr:hypothetical protein BKA61DRAFT_603966 [Leptodontidium sp. MPI-SDFR-AT-0119]